MFNNKSEDNIENFIIFITIVYKGELLEVCHNFIEQTMQWDRWPTNNKSQISFMIIHIMIPIMGDKNTITSLSK